MSDYTKEQYQKALKQPLLTDSGALTEAGIIVCEYGTEKAITHPELSDAQQMEVIVEHFPVELRDESLAAAINNYHSGMVFGDLLA